MKFGYKEKKNQVSLIHNIMRNIVLKKKKRNTFKINQPFYLTNPELFVRNYNINDVWRATMIVRSSYIIIKYKQKDNPSIFLRR